MPPAVHTEISPRFAVDDSDSCLASCATIRVPVAANGWPMATLEPLRGSKAHVGALLDSVDSAAELVEQLTT